jgi:DNA-binding beta-propeller fold protein YncE
VVVALAFLFGGSGLAANATNYLSPTALAATRDGTTVFVACAGNRQVLFWDAMGQKVVRTLSMPQSPSGLAVSADNTRLYVTCAGPASTVCVVEVVRHKIIGTFPAGHTAQAPVLSPDGKTLYVCNQFDNDVSVIDLSAGRHPASMRIAVPREPVAADVTPDGKYLLVANQLHSGRADGEEVAAVVSVIDTAAGRVVRELPLPSGSEVLKGLRCRRMVNSRRSPISSPVLAGPPRR